MADRFRFERGARNAYPGLRGAPTKPGANSGFRYDLQVTVPFYETRTVTVIFPGRQRIPLIFVDGPAASPHRYEDGALCIWHPMDPPAMRWRFEHGLLDLLDAIRAHLLREAWWREHNEWLGPEVTHAPDSTFDTHSLEAA